MKIKINVVGGWASLAPLPKITNGGLQIMAVDWGKFDHLIGKFSDNKIAKLAGCSAAAVRNRRLKLERAPVQKKADINWRIWDTELGKADDEAIAEKIGCDRSTVTARRNALNIPSYNAPEYIDWAKWDKLLGVEEDAILARLIGCHASSVSARREKLEQNWKWGKR